VNIQEYIQSGLVEAYVLGVATEQERQELDLLKNQHPEIQTAITNFEDSLQQAAFATAIAPKPSVKQNLQQLLQADFDNATTTTIAPIEKTVNTNISQQTNNNHQQAIVKPMFAQKWAVAAAILLICSAALNVYYYNKYNTTNQQMLALLNEKNNLQASNQNMQVKYLDLFNNLQITTNPNMIKVTMPGVKGLENNLATVFWDSKTKDVYMLANQLPTAPSGMQYQLWALVDGKPIDAGVVGDCNGVCKLKNIPQAQAFAVTLEKEGGSPTPNLAALQVMGKVG
jgi:anti-sigma-K factor RskA